MLKKTFVDSLINDAMASMDVDAIRNVRDFRDVLCAQLNSSSEMSLWKWKVGERYITKGTTKKHSMTFSISGIYDNSYKVVIALVRVMDPPGDYLAFPYDVLENCVRVELAITGNAQTKSTLDEIPVVYGVSIGLTDYVPYWQTTDAGQECWSRESFELIRYQSAGFRTAETVIEEDRGNLHNAIYRNERCHLSFALDWSINWNPLGSGRRFVYVAPKSLVKPEDVARFVYSHNADDSRFIPFLKDETKAEWESEHENLSDKSQSGKIQADKVPNESPSKPEKTFASKRLLTDSPQETLDLDRERAQVLHHWRSIDPARLLRRTEIIIGLIRSGKEANAGREVREFHNVLGYKAWGIPESGGKCGGCIYRSSEFTRLQPGKRVSTKNDPFRPATIHLEHLVPVKALVENIKVLIKQGADAHMVQRFLLQLSVSVALHATQGRMAERGDGGLIKQGLSSATNVFTVGHDHYQLPFMRYDSTTNGDSTIYNVLNGEVVVFQSYTQEQAKLDVVRAIQESGNKLGLLEVATHPDNGLDLIDTEIAV